MTRAEIDEYIHEKLPSFEGWMPLLRELLDVLLKNGWNKSMVFTAKEKYGKFVLKTADVQLEKFGLVIEEFEEKINKACIICGDEAKQCSIGGYEVTYCLTHYLNEFPKISGIDKYGFTLHGERYFWKEIEKISGHPDWWGCNELKEDSERLACITLELNPNFFSSHVREFTLAWIRENDLNWIHFLANIPNIVLDTNPLLRDYIIEFLASFYFCEICGKKALFAYEENYYSCKLCTNPSWESMSDRHQKFHVNKEKYVKKNQIQYFSGSFNYELNKLDISFIQNKDFKRLFSNDELAEYKQL